MYLLLACEAACVHGEEIEDECRCLCEDGWNGIQCDGESDCQKVLHTKQTIMTTGMCVYKAEFF